MDWISTGFRILIIENQLVEIAFVVKVKGLSHFAP